MKSIIGYILNMMPYMIITIPIYLIIRIVIFKTKKKEFNWYHETGLFLFVIFLVGLASQTIIPKFEFGIYDLIGILLMMLSFIISFKIHRKKDI